MILTRIAFIGLLWSVFFLEGIRVVLLINWRFDIFNSNHWQYAWDLWLSGWIIDDSKEWAFILIILSFIPLWLTGWAALSLIPWEVILKKLLKHPLKLFGKLVALRPVKNIQVKESKKTMQKTKSYKEVRPRSLRNPIDERTESVIAAPSAIPNNVRAPAATSRPISAPPPRAMAAPVPMSAKPADQRNFEHSLFKMDEGEDFDLDFDSFDKIESKKEATPPPPPPPPSPAKRDKEPAPSSNNKKNKTPPPPAQQSQPQADNKPSGNSVVDVLKQKGFEVITGATIKNNLVDFIGIANKEICLCLIDKEAGDWLADEERFNDEEPLWFSESSHRISPVRKLDIARKTLEKKLQELDFSFAIKAYLIVKIGNIINTEDMLETWEGLDISVTRIDRGSPKELKLFSKTLEDANGSINKDKFEKLKKIIRNLS